MGGGEEVAAAEAGAVDVYDLVVVDGGWGWGWGWRWRWRKGGCGGF